MLNACYIKLVCFGYFAASGMEAGRRKQLNVREQPKRDPINVSCGFQVYCCQLKYGFPRNDFPSEFILSTVLEIKIKHRAHGFFHARSVSQSEITINLTNLNLKKCFIYELFDDACCDSGGKKFTR